MNIGIDLMGGDYAPLEAVKGIHEYLHSGKFSKKTNLTITAIGNRDAIAPLFTAHQLNHIAIIHADEVIGYHEHPTKALKEKPNSSIAIGFHLLATQKIDAFISAGNTGAMLVGALFSIKAIEGVIRPTIATIIPKVSGRTGILLDVGLNADCKPEHLDQFAVLGSLYAQHILNITNPKVGLLNVGEEEGKGNILAQTTYPLLKNNPHIQFAGNVEGRDLFEDKADIIVCDGFTGNVVLKLAESFYDIACKRNLQNDAYIQRFHYENYGGTPVLGVSKPVIIGHGISNAKAFANMIDVAEKMIETELCKKIQVSFKAS
ncbi:phosphate acyltransferase PlsX [Hydrotalea sp.]|uniref:phosphate acyltransferase PlsX n=1 Tax=Hydrotalea sp. TaxID=2881279 RepID=UPI00261C45AC|nr:phosphate acyltransferase PlsX [Hydrotalea sp.]